MDVPQLARKGPLLFLLHYLGRRWRSHLLVVLGVTSAVACAIATQYAVKNLVDAMSAAADPRLLWRAVLVLLVLVAGDNLLWRIAGRAATHAFVAVGVDLRLDLFEHLSGHGTRYFADQFPGALSGRVMTAATAAAAIENSLAWTSFPPAAAALSAIAVLSLVDWQLTAVLVAVTLLLGLYIGWAASKAQPLHARYASEAAGVSGDVADAVANVALVRIFGAARREQARLAHRLGCEMQAQRASLRALEKLRLLHAVTVFIVTAGILVWAVWLWQQHRITTGDVVLSTSLGFTLLHASRDFAMALVELVQHFARLGEAIGVLGQEHEMRDAPGVRSLIHLGGFVSFVDVGFSYPDGRRVLERVSFEIPGGQKVGLVGPSGAGKSTILALIQRLYDPQRGRVLIDGQDIAGVTLESLRESIAVVHQDVALFHRSIEENLRYGRPQASAEEVYHAAKSAHCLEFIERLPHGFGTIVGERGLKLSGGQRQRLAIARAFLRDAPIILFDEATSSLDSESERLVQQALLELMEGRTLIAIAHRLSTLDRFDRIIVLNEGRIIEDGAPADLLRRGGAYSRMRNVQSAPLGEER